MSITTLMARPRVLREDERTGQPAHPHPFAPDTHLDALREELAQSIALVAAERERVRRVRDAIPPLERRFNTAGHRLWLQLDDWLNGLDAALADAPALDDTTPDPRSR